MSQLSITLADGRSSYRPGEAISGSAAWSLDETPENVELRLFWHTQGKGDEDVGIAESVVFETPERQDKREFRLRAPEGPYSFSGKLVSLLWAVEVVAQPGALAGRAEITLSPTGKEVLLHVGS